MLPDLASLDRFLQVMGNGSVIHHGDVELLVFAGPLAQLKGLGRRDSRRIVIVVIQLFSRQSLITEREIRIEFDRALIERNCLWVIAAVGLL